MCFAVVDEPRLFVLRERLSAPRLISGQHHFFHGGGEAEVLCRHVEDGRFYSLRLIDEMKKNLCAKCNAGLIADFAKQTGITFD